MGELFTMSMRYGMNRLTSLYSRVYSIDDVREEPPVIFHGCSDLNAIKYRKNADKAPREMFEKL